MAKKKLDTLIDDDNPVMEFLDKAQSAGGYEEPEIELRKRAKEMKISEFTQIPELRDIFPRDEKIMEYITAQIREGFDPAEPIVYWKHDGKNIIVDGNTRFECTKAAEKEKILAIEREFTDLEEAVAYAKHRQVRRNLTDQQVYMIANADIKTERGSGRDVEKKAKMTGLSPSTIQHAKTVNKKASEETKEKLKNGEISLNQAYETVNPPKKKKQKKDEEEQLSDALDEPRGEPKSLTIWDHSDGIERPDYSNKENPENEADRLIIARQEAYKEGHNAGLKEGCEIAEKLFYFAIGEIRKGRSPDEVLNDERVSDFSPSVISTFELPEEDENGGEA